MKAVWAKMRLVQRILIGVGIAALLVGCNSEFLRGLFGVKPTGWWDFPKFNGPGLLLLTAYVCPNKEDCEVNITLIKKDDLGNCEWSSDFPQLIERHKDWKEQNISWNLIAPNDVEFDANGIEFEEGQSDIKSKNKENGKKFKVKIKEEKAKDKRHALLLYNVNVSWAGGTKRCTTPKGPGVTNRG